MKEKHPREQKRLGRGVAGYSDERWAKVRYQIVLVGTLEKYRQNPELKKLLLATGNDTFVEASPKDKIWGIGMDEDNPNATRPEKWLGQNLLGKAITEARNIIREEENG